MIKNISLTFGLLTLAMFSSAASTMASSKFHLDKVTPNTVEQQPAANLYAQDVPYHESTLYQNHQRENREALQRSEEERALRAQKEAEEAAESQKAELSQLALQLERKRDYIGLAQVKTQQGDADGALAAYTRAIKINPKHAVAYVYRGFTKRIAKKDLLGAMADYNKAIELNPTSSPAAVSYLFRSRLKREMNDRSGAIKDLRRAFQLRGEISPALADEFQKLGVTP